VENWKKMHDFLKKKTKKVFKKGKKRKK